MKLIKFSIIVIIISSVVFYFKDQGVRFKGGREYIINNKVKNMNKKLDFIESLDDDLKEVALGAQKILDEFKEANKSSVIGWRKKTA